MTNFCLEIKFFFVKLPEKIEIFWKFAWKNRFFREIAQNFSEICLEKSIFFTWIHDPQISNQIDTTDKHDRVGPQYY